MSKLSIGQGGFMSREDRMQQIYDTLGSFWELSSVGVAHACKLKPGQHVRGLLFEMLEREMIGAYKTYKPNKMVVYMWYRLDRDERYRQGLFDDGIPF